MSTRFGIEVYELDERGADGIEVALLWNARTNEVFVDVVDARNGESLRIGVDAADALDAFRHPYAYASRHVHKHALAA